MGQRIPGLGDRGPVQTTVSESVLHRLRDWTELWLAPKVHELRYRWARDRFAGGDRLGSGTPTVTLACVTNRPGQLGHILSIWQSQTHPNTTLTIVTNADGYRAGPRLDELGVGPPQVTLIETAPSVTLGECLNLALAQCQTDVFAKIDDDDEYAPTYVADAIAAMRSSGAAIVGKQSVFAWLSVERELILRFPARAHQFVGRVAGGTIVAHAASVRAIGFPHRNVGEDGGFFRRCERAGLRIWSAEPNGYLYVRGADHAWERPSDEFRRESVRVGDSRAAVEWV